MNLVERDFAQVLLPPQIMQYFPKKTYILLTYILKHYTITDLI